MRFLILYALCAILLLSRSESKAQCPGPVPLTIDNITTTESRCQASGTANIQVSGGVAPYWYTLTSGPVTATIQSSNIFKALSRGTYAVEVSDNCNNKAVASFSITGDYAVPSVVNTITPPTCPGFQDGTILINVSNGRGPFSYALVAPSPVIIPEQSSNLFSGLPAGEFTYQVRDSCGNIQTRTVTLADNQNNSFAISALHVRWVACDSFAVSYRLNIDAGSNLSKPFRSSLKLPDGRMLLNLLTVYSAIIEDTFRFSYQHTKGADDWLELTVQNGCDVTKMLSRMMGLDMKPVKSSAGNCEGDYTYTFDKDKDNSNEQPNVHCIAITYTLVNPSGDIVATQVNNSTFAGFPPASGYKVIREDCCMKDTLLFDWEIGSAKQPPTYSIFSACRNGLAVIRLSTNSGIPGNVILISGPPSISLPSGEVKGHIYPDTVKNLFNGATTATIGYFGEGNYRFCFIDTCGKRDTSTVTISASHLKKYSFTPSLVRGCVNNNKILLNGTNNNVSIGADEVTIKSATTNVRKPLPRLLLKDSLINLPPGNYQVQYRSLSMSAGYFLKNMSAGCDLLDTLIRVPAYRQPGFHNTATIGGCGGDRLIKMKPDSTAGLLPFEYIILSGPETRTAQADPIFRDLPQGTYTLLMMDACNNSYSSSVSVEALINPIPEINFDCQYKSLLLSTSSPADYQYSWTHPDGSTTNDSYLYIDPVSDSDTGTYKLTATSMIGGCVYQEESSLRVDYCFVLPTGLKTITAQRQSQGNDIKWMTVPDHLYTSFVLERSQDRKTFIPINSKHASPEIIQYKITDTDAPSGVCWYRLTMIEKNGTLSYSQVIMCAAGKANTMTVYPVPLQQNNLLTVSHGPALQNATMQLISPNGQLLFRQSVKRLSTLTMLDLKDLNKGTYFLLYFNGVIREVAKVIKLH